MSNVNYSASCLKETAKQTLPQGMKKAMRKRHMTTISIKQLEDEQINDGTKEKVMNEYLQLETEQPTYSSCYLKRLQPDESKAAGEELKCQTDNELALEVPTVELLQALVSMAGHVIDLTLHEDGVLELHTDEATITIEGTRVEASDAPERIEGDIVLHDLTPLHQALSAAMKIAVTDSNEEVQKCLHLHLKKDALIVESSCQGTLCSYEANDIYEKAPEEDVDVVLSLSTCNSLQMLLGTNESKEVRIKTQTPQPPLGGDNNVQTPQPPIGGADYNSGVSNVTNSPLRGLGGPGLLFQVDRNTLMADAQDVVCRDYCEERDHTFGQTFPVDRKKMLSALRTIKGMDETEVNITLGYDAIMLAGPSEKNSSTSVKVPILEGKCPQGVVGGYECAVGRFAIAPFITALSTCYTETEARLGHDEKGTKLAIDCGCLRIMQAPL